MSLEDLANLGELFGGVAVVVSLVYLAVQVRHGSSAARTATTAGILGNSAHMNSIMAGDVAPVIAKRRAGESLDEEDTFRYSTFMYGIMSQHWQVHYQFHQGMLDDEIFEAYRRRTRFILQNPGVLEWWAEFAFRFPDSFREWVDALIRELREEGALE